MGTRNLTAVMLDGEYKVAQYGQWDGYPSGQGATVLLFCRELLKNNRALFEEKLRAARWIDDEEVVELGERWKMRFPHLSRDICAKILNTVLTEPNGIVLQNNIAFAGESLFCEFAYVIDLDKNTLEVFTGFNKSPLSEGDRFYEIPVSSDVMHDGTTKYYQVRLAESYSLDHLPDQEQFEKDLWEEDDEE